jgi:hypothetical protein
MSARKKWANCHDRPNYYGGKCKECYEWLRDPSCPCPHDDRKKDGHGRCSSCNSRWYALKRSNGEGRNFGTPRATELIGRKRGSDYEPKRWRVRKLEELREKQKGLCSICGQFDEKGLCLDHDHRCCPLGGGCEGCVRGALCHGCNMRLGQLESDLVGRSLDYLLKYRGGPLGVNEEIRIESETGGQKGQKLARFDLMPPAALWEVAETYGRGALKYSDPYNYMKGYNWSLSYQAMMRHANAFWAGQSRDPKDGNHHLASVVWHAFALMQFERQELGTDDRVRNYPKTKTEFGIDSAVKVDMFTELYGNAECHPEMPNYCGGWCKECYDLSGGKAKSASACSITPNNV